MAKEPENPKEDRAIDLTLRPASWDEYVGQEKIKGNLSVILEAAKKRKEVSDHLLFSGPAGLGKTTLAYLVARELGGMVKRHPVRRSRRQGISRPCSPT